MGMGCPDISTSVCRPPEHDWNVYQPTGHVPDICCVIKNLIECNIAETPKHKLHDWPHAHHGRPNGKSGKSSFAYGGIDNSFRAEFFQHALGNLVRALELSDFFSHEDNLVISGNFLRKRLIECFSISNCSHLKSGEI